MSTKPSILTIGIEPSLLDFSSPDFAAMPGLSAEKIMAGIVAEEARFAEAGYEVQRLLTDLGETAAQATREALQAKAPDIVVIGAGIRALPSNLQLFEQLINVIHEHAPQAKFAFNTNPTDSLEAVRRWI